MKMKKTTVMTRLSPDTVSKVEALTARLCKIHRKDGYTMAEKYLEGASIDSKIYELLCEAEASIKRSE